MSTPVRIHNNPFDLLRNETACTGNCACWRDGFDAGQGYADGFREGADDGEAGRPAELPELPDDAPNAYRAGYMVGYGDGFGDGLELRRLSAARAAALSEIARLEAEIAAAKDRAA